MKRRLYTIGYEKRKLGEAIDQLTEASVNVLIDVRELPQSRIQGFSKTALSVALTERGIEYRHVRELGSPRELRHSLRETGDFSAFTRGFLRHLDRQIESVRKVQQLAYKKTCCLLCFERNHQECHRQFVAQRIKEVGRNGLEILHL